MSSRFASSRVGVPGTVGTPPPAGATVPHPYGNLFLDPPDLSAGTQQMYGPDTGYPRWYWYTYLYWELSGATGHPHPPIGTPAPDFLQIPYPDGNEFVFLRKPRPYAGNSWGDTPLFVGERVRPGDPDYAYWSWMWANDGGKTPIPNPPPEPPPQPPTGPQPQFKDDSWAVSVGPLSVTDGLISGTNVNKAFRIEIASKYQPTVPAMVPTHTDVRLDKVEFFVGDLSAPLSQAILPERVGNGPQTPPAALPARPAGVRPTNWLPTQRSLSFKPNDPSALGGTCPYYPQIRFASTHFPDGTQVPVKMRVTFRLLDDGSGKSSKPDADLVLETPTYVYTVCNKALAMATRLYVNGQPGYRHRPDASATEPDYDWDSKRAILGRDLAGNPDGMGALDLLPAPKMNHTLLEPTPMLRRTAILAVLKQATAFFAFTHGEPGGTALVPSEGAGGGEPSSADLLVFHTDIKQTVWNDRRNPWMNLVLPVRLRSARGWATIERGFQPP